MEKEIYLQYYPEDKEIHIWLHNAEETKTVSNYNNGINYQEIITTLENRQFFELYNTLAETNIKEFLENNGEGDQQCTASSGVDDKNQQVVAHNKSCQDEQKCEDFSPSSAPGDQDGATFEIAFGGFNDKVSFQLQVHKTNMEQRKVKTICETVKRILQIAEIDRAEYENDF